MIHKDSAELNLESQFITSCHIMDFRFDNKSRGRIDRYCQMRNGAWERYFSALRNPRQSFSRTKRNVEEGDGKGEGN